MFPPDILWLGNENRPLSQNGKYSYPKYGEDISHHRLIIHNITLRDNQSVFSCQVTAGGWKIQSPNAKLKVTRRKGWYWKNTGRAEEGRMGKMAGGGENFKIGRRGKRRQDKNIFLKHVGQTLFNTVGWCWTVID